MRQQGHEGGVNILPSLRMNQFIKSSNTEMEMFNSRHALEGNVGKDIFKFREALGGIPSAVGRRY